MTIKYNNDLNAESITSDDWLKIIPCLTEFEHCDSVQVDINEDLVEVDVERIPALISALEKAHQLATDQHPVMDIRFRFSCSYKGELTIDGKEMELGISQGCFRLNGLTNKERDSTLGGMVADNLYGRFYDVIKAWVAADDEHPNCVTWDTLADDAADAAHRRL